MRTCHDLREDLAPRLRMVLEAGEAFRKKKGFASEHVGYMTTRNILACLESSQIDFGKLYPLLGNFENQMVRYDNELLGLEQAQGLLPPNFAVQTYQIIETLIRGNPPRE